MNLVSGQARSYASFSYTCIIPEATELAVSFSPNGIAWYNSSGGLGGTDPMSQGFGVVELSGLDWNISGFYYKVDFLSEAPESPRLIDVELAYHEYTTSGTFTSAPIDNEEYLLSWRWIAWAALRPEGTHVKVQLRSAPNRDEMLQQSFVGPDGNTTTYYSSSETDIWDGHDGHRWFQYRLYLSTLDSSVTPSVDSVSFIYNTLPDVEVETPDSKRSGHIPINYTLSDGDGDEVDIVVQYRTGFSMYQVASPASGSEGTYDLLTSPAGVGHVFLWDSRADLGPGQSDDVFIRITPSDSDMGMPGETVRFTVDNQPPAFISTSPSGYVNTRNVTLVVETDENANVRWDSKNLSYGDMKNQFEEGQGTMRHTTAILASPGPNTVYVSAMDTLGNGRDAGIRIDFIVDVEPPEKMQVLIENGVEVTNSTTVNITLMGTRSPGGTLLMMFANDSSFEGAIWENFTPYKIWELSPGDGEKTVYVALKDSAGNVAVSEGSIVLDTTPPTVTVLSPKDETDSRHVILRVRTDEEAYIRWGYSDEDYRSMTRTFDEGEGTILHNLSLNATEGRNVIYLTSMDMYGNAMGKAEKLSFVVNLSGDGGGGGGSEGGGGGNGGEGGDEDKGGESEGNWWIFAIIFLNLLVLFFVIVYRIQSKNRKRAPEPKDERVSLRKDDILGSLHGKRQPVPQPVHIPSGSFGGKGYTTTQQLPVESPEMRKQDYDRVYGHASYASGTDEEYGVGAGDDVETVWDEVPTVVPEPPVRPVWVPPAEEMSPDEASGPGQEEPRAEAAVAQQPKVEAAGAPQSSVQITPQAPEVRKPSLPPVRGPGDLSPSELARLSGAVRAPVKKEPMERRGHPKVPERQKKEQVKRKELASILDELKADVRGATNADMPLKKRKLVGPDGKARKVSMDDISDGLDSLLGMFGGRGDGDGSDDDSGNNSVALARIPIRRIAVENGKRGSRR